MRIERIPVDAIVVPSGRRDCDPANVAALADSISKIGLLQPLSVYTDNNAEATLVAGRNRLEAVKSLGWDEVDVIFLSGDDIDRRMAEISENLHRAELTALEQSLQIDEWRKLSEQKAKGAQLEPPGGVQSHEKGIKKTARELGVSRGAVERATKIASITPEAKAAAVEAGIDDNQRKLLEVAKVEPSKQVATVHQLAAHKPTRVDGDVRERAAHDVAEMIAEYVPGDAWATIKSNLYAAGAANIANALTNITGQSIMDARFK